jgi:hypothetical protein
VSQLLRGLSKTLKASDHVAGKMATRGSKNITEVLVASAKFSEGLQEYMVHYWNIITITFINLSSLLKRRRRRRKGHAT